MPATAGAANDVRADGDRRTGSVAQAGQ
jgi:hypothetical protein